MRPFEKQTQKVKIKKRENQGINETKATANTPKSINVVAKKCKKKTIRTERARMRLQSFFKKGQEKKLKLS